VVAVLRVNSGDVAAEADTLLRLGRHPRLVRYLGQCKDGHETLLTMEYAPMGALDQYIEDVEDTITVAHREAMLLQVCSGMEALADAHLIHRDLALRNILVFGYSADDVSKTSVKVRHCGRCGSLVVLSILN
jgi:serine/threonine protein kinase